MEKFLQVDIITANLMKFLSLRNAAVFARSFRTARGAVNRHYRYRTRFLEKEEERDEKTRKQEPATSEKKKEKKHIFIRMSTILQFGEAIQFACAGCGKPNLRLKFLLDQFEMVAFLDHCQRSEINKPLRFLCRKCHASWTTICKASHRALWPGQSQNDIPLLSIEMKRRRSAVNDVLCAMDVEKSIQVDMSKQRAKKLLQSYPDAFPKKKEQKKKQRKRNLWTAAVVTTYGASEHCVSTRP